MQPEHFKTMCETTNNQCIYFTSEQNKSTKVEYIANNEKNEKLHPPSGNEKSFQDKVIYSRLLGVKISGTGGCPFKKIYN